MTRPLASYRLQINARFTFDDAAAIVPYLRDLGISHLYLSPVMEAVAGSNHGYDVTDFDRLSAERGGEAGFDRLVRALGDDMRLIIDIVPNHMATAPENRPWAEALAHGPASPYWKFFDLFPERQGQVVLPLLEDAPEVLWQQGVLRVEEHEGRRALRYHDQFFPLAPDTAEAKSYEDVARQQHYRLASWRDRSFTFRRFFHLASLVGLRVEDETVRRGTHARLFALMERYPVAIDGLRVDHIDGLAAPRDYLLFLQRHGRRVWVEKILSGDERLRDWPAAGTTGYEFIGALNAVFTEREGFCRLQSWWQSHVEPRWGDFNACVIEAKAEAMERLFPGHVAWLAALMAPDEPAGAAEFIRQLTSVLPVYRIYGTGAQDRQIMLEAQEAARRHYGAAFDRNAEKFLPLLAGDRADARVSMAWRQFSGAAMAKGLEDCAHYRYTPLAALNEVGCTPDLSPDAGFAGFINSRAQAQPQGMNATSTHDTKRSEDVRARLYALADRPERWAAFFEKMKRMAAPEAAGVTDAVFHFLLQALIGTWPLQGAPDDDYRGRIKDYMEKSAREEGRHVALAEGESPYLEKLAALTQSLLQRKDFTAAMEEFSARLALQGAINSLGALTLKCLSPGLPDIYQGCDLWDFSLVDPDNRRPVDYGARRDMMRRAREAEEREDYLRHLCATWKSGEVKLWLTRRLLSIRRQFLNRDDVRIGALPAAAIKNGGLQALLLQAGDEALLVVHPLYPGKLDESLKDISLPQEFCRQASVTLPPGLQGGEAWDLLAGRAMKGDFLPDALARFPIVVARLFPPREQERAGPR